MSDREMRAIAELKDGLKDMIRGERLTATMIPNDFKALKEMDEATAEANGESIEKHT